MEGSKEKETEKGNQSKTENKGSTEIERNDSKGVGDRKTNRDTERE